jgi:hypothetical protein
MLLALARPVFGRDGTPASPRGAQTPPSSRRGCAPHLTASHAASSSGKKTTPASSSPRAGSSFISASTTTPSVPSEPRTGPPNPCRDAADIRRCAWRYADRQRGHLEIDSLAAADIHDPARGEDDVRAQHVAGAYRHNGTCPITRRCWLTLCAGQRANHIPLASTRPGHDRLSPLSPAGRLILHVVHLTSAASQRPDRHRPRVRVGSRLRLSRSRITKS